MNESSQSSEHAAVAVIARFCGRLLKVCLFGDTKKTLSVIQSTKIRLAWSAFSQERKTKSGNGVSKPLTKLAVTLFVCADKALVS